MVPIYKKKAVTSASNYRGIHLTAHLSKVAERPLLPLVEPHISCTFAFGPNQFAKTQGRGSLPHDVVAPSAQSPHESRRLLLGRGQGFRQSSARSKGVHPSLDALASSWLQQRTAQVVVDGLNNVGFPGHHAGLHPLEHAWRAIREASFVEIVYADDLNGFTEFEHNASVDSLIAGAKTCQSELHKLWGGRGRRRYPHARC